MVTQQFDVVTQIAEHGLMPIIEPEISIKSSDKAGAEAILLAELTEELDALPDGRQVMLKLTTREVPDFYSALVDPPRVARLSRFRAAICAPTPGTASPPNHGIIASFRGP